MTAQDLKNSILQLAIQGKLVEQRVGEGTAKELLEQIKAEKERLIKEKKIKKEKALPEIAEEEITFDIPESWEWVRAGTILSVFGGKRIPAGRNLVDYDTGYKYIRVADMEKGSVSSEKIKYIPVDIYEKIKAYKISKNDVYITVAGTIGQVGIVPEELDESNLTENANKLVVYANYQKYIYYMMCSPFVQNQIIKATTRVGQPKLAIMRIQSLLLPLPQFEEQKRIVAKIEELLPYVEQYDMAYSKLEVFNKKFPEDMQKSILQYAIQGKLVEQRPQEGSAEELYQQIQVEKAKLIKEGKIKKDKPLGEIIEDEIPFEIPESWKWVRLNDIFQINPRNNIDDKIQVSFIPMTLLEAGYKSDFSYEIKEWGEIKKGFTHFKDGDIVVAKITPCFQNLKSAILKELKNGYGAGTTELHVLRPIGEICLEYFFWFVKNPLFISNCESNMSGTAGQQRVGTDIIKSLLVPLPPIEEQKRIVQAIETYLPYCQQLIK